jgi:hypothetical protein
MEDQEINKQLKSQNLKGKIALILGIINLSLLLIGLQISLSKITVRWLVFWRILDFLDFGGGFLAALVGIIFGFMGRKSIMGKIGIILCAISLVVSVFIWWLISISMCCL